MRTFRLPLGRIAVGLLAAFATRGGGQASPAASAVPAQAAFRSPSASSDSAYSGLERDFLVGKTVYLRSSKMLIGTIQATDSNHAFPRTFPRPHMKAVLIRRKDGPLEWTPVEQVARVYVVNK
jgi:hypothetical protein